MKYTIENEHLRADVLGHGAELCSLHCKATGRELIWQGDPAIWSGHSPLLFPVVGKLKDDRYLWEGRWYSMQKHGFAKTSDFQPTHQEPHALTLTLQDSQKTRPIYPFSFTLHLDFLLVDRTLQINHRVHNPSAGHVLPFSIGAHPGLACSLGDVLTFETREEPQAYRLGEDMLLSPSPQPIPLQGNQLIITKELFAQDALILQDPHSHYASLGPRDGAPWVRVDWFTAPVLGLWAKPGAPYLCVEPWQGIDDGPSSTGKLTEKLRMVLLPPGETFAFPLHLTSL